MHSPYRFILRNTCEHLRTKPVSSLLAHPSLSSNLGSCHHVHVSHSRSYSVPPTLAPNAAQVADVPLKIASASGNTPPPEEPEDSGDPETPHQSEIPLSSPRPASSDSFARPPSRARGRPRGSSSRRPVGSQRPRKPETFKPAIPEWFLQRNVTLFDNLNVVTFSLENPSPSEKSDSTEPSAPAKEPSSGIEGTRISVSPYIQNELEAHLSASLLVRPGGPRDNVGSRKAHIHLQCPKRGALYFLDEIVEHAAKVLKADMVRLDGQDLDELLEDLIDPASPEMGMAHPQIVFTNIVRDNSKDIEEKDEFNPAEENEEVGEEEDSPEDGSEFRLPSDMPMRLFRLFATRPMYPSMLNPGSTTPGSSSSPGSKGDTETKVSTYLDLLISAPINKRRDAAGLPHPVRPSRTIVYLRDFQSILDTPRGQIAHQALLNVIHNRRRAGEKIVLVVSDDLPTDNIIPGTLSNQYYHVIKIPLPKSESEKIALQEDKDSRTREINLRSIQSAIRQRSRTPSMEFECPVGIHLDSTATSAIVGLDKEIWDVNKVQRVASIAMGNHGRWLEQHKIHDVVPITIASIAQAVNDVVNADQERTERKKEIKAAREAQNLPDESGDLKSESTTPPPIKSKDCNKHEQKLLGGVIDPDKIKVGFSDIRAPESTIETLKILVSLPLKRPDAFSYGVLSKNFINGVLLFGPPGTGKTMLAKAVAKESGARVLEIKGSEVYDMYVGEGEKNVKAIFSLARKLSPCVVFIDEVDTIFSSRNASERHVSHREIINQFMAEWDGINSLNNGVLILGATNRPFDLDDAILRRMPRRILVDLPTEDDRLAILKLLLVDEQLDPAVDLKSLASRTNLYSGSDLKNVCVSAAVAAVTEEKPSQEILKPSSDQATTPTDEKEAVLSRRVLRPAHFEQALTEVTPSISESMETIELLRKFDKQYGNVKNKKKKMMGFGTEAPEAIANVRA